MEFGTVNLDQDPPAKYHGRYDVVIATNMVHAKKDLVASTSRMKSILKNGGFICCLKLPRSSTGTTSSSDFSQAGGHPRWPNFCTVVSRGMDEGLEESRIRIHGLLHGFQ